MSARMPWMLSAGMRETVPTETEPLPTAVISSRPLSVSAPAVNFKRRLRERFGRLVDGNHRLAVFRLVAPDEAHLDRRRPSLAGQPNAADVLLALDSPKPAWAMPRGWSPASVIRGVCWPTKASSRTIVTVAPPSAFQGDSLAPTA